MLALFLAIMAAVWLIAADEASAIPYNTRVHSSVVFVRSGERTPSLASAATLPDLTSYGAQQMYAVGAAFRDRYMGTVNASESPLAINRIVGISNYTIENSQLFVLTQDSPSLVASAQAFVQGLYPPFTLNEARVGQALLDPASVLANSSYVEYPLGGYQYAQVQSISSADPEIMYLAGDRGCVNRAASAARYFTTEEFRETRLASKELYHEVGEAALGGVLTSNQWDYIRAYDIYEYLDFQIRHDITTHDMFAENDTLAADFDRVRWLASQQEWAFYGNRTVDNGLRTIAGETLAAKVLGQMYTAISSNGSSAKLNLMFGDYEPFVSFFSIANIGRLNSNFYGLPDYGSSMVFELYSAGSADDTAFPSEDHLWVKFYFRNGSDTSDDLQAFPIFSRGPSETDMKWKDFETSMMAIMKSSMADWCSDCGAANLFCAAVNSTRAITIITNGLVSSSSTTAKIAGVIGAGATLGALSILLALAMLLGGVRFHRVTRSKKSDLGGFKGSAKLASDADLALPKSGAPMSAGASIDPTKARERVGSWELKNKEFGRPVTQDDDNISVNPFADPVKPDERV